MSLWKYGFRVEPMKPVLAVARDGGSQSEVTQLVDEEVAGDAEGHDARINADGIESGRRSASDRPRGREREGAAGGTAQRAGVGDTPLVKGEKAKLPCGGGPAPVSEGSDIKYEACGPLNDVGLSPTDVDQQCNSRDGSGLMATGAGDVCTEMEAAASRTYGGSRSEAMGMGKCMQEESTMEQCRDGSAMEGQQSAVRYGLQSHRATRGSTIELCVSASDKQNCQVKRHGAARSGEGAA